MASQFSEETKPAGPLTGNWMNHPQIRRGIPFSHADVLNTRKAAGMMGLPEMIVYGGQEQTARSDAKCVGRGKSG